MDIEPLRALPWLDLNRLFDVAVRLNGMSKQEVEDIEGNSDAATDAASS